MSEEYVEEFAGLPVVIFNGETDPAGLPPAASAAWKVATRWDGKPFGEVFGRFLEYVDTSQVTGLIIGLWELDDGSEDVDPVDLLVGVADRFPKLRALFLGDIEDEEQMISCINHSDVSPLLGVFPLLERLEVRGDLSAFGAVRSDTLKMLRVESSLLRAEVAQGVAASELPSLEHLELWLGAERYPIFAGTGAATADLAPILSGERLPALRHLGLQNSEIQDEIAVAVARAPIVARLESLSLAMGNLTDEGAEALLSGQPLTHLKELDLHHHYLSDQMIDRVHAALAGVDVDLSEQEMSDDDRYVAVDE